MGIAEVPFFHFCISKIVVTKVPLFLELDFVFKHVGIFSVRFRNSLFINVYRTPINLRLYLKSNSRLHSFTFGNSILADIRERKNKFSKKYKFCKYRFKDHRNSVSMFQK